MTTDIPLGYGEALAPARLRVAGGVVASGDARGLTHSVLRGLLWAFVGTGGQGVLKIAVLMILARLLSPHEFGVVSAALVVVGLSAVFSQLGVGPAVVQRPGLTHDHLRAGFTLSVLLGAITAAALFSGAPLAAGFFRLPELVPVMRVLSAMFVVQGVSVVAESLLLRGLEFRRIAFIDLVAFGLGYGAVGVTLALLRFGVWALVGAQMAQTVLRMCLLLGSQRHPLVPLFQRRAMGDLLYFGGGHTAARIGNYTANQADNMVVGRWLGAVALGTYDRAYALMAAPAMFLGEMLDRVMFPAMVRVQDDRQRLATAYLRSVSITALTMLPASAVLLVLAPEVVAVVLGPRWGAVVAPFQVFACGLLLRTSYKTSDSLARATGSVYRRAWRQGAYAALVGVGAWIGHFWGLVGVALGVLLAIVVNFALMAQLSMRLTRIPARALWKAHRHALLLAVLLGLEAWLIAGPLRARHAGALGVLGAGVAGPMLTVVLLLAFAPRFALGAEGVWMLRRIAPRAAWAPWNREPAVASDEVGAGPDPPANGGAARGTLVVGSLELVRELAARLERAEIRYCHFKSNQHLAEGMLGITDMDVLVDRLDGTKLFAVLTECDFKRFTPAPGGAYSAIEDYLGMDQRTGRLVHLHLHYRLTTGERHLKGYRLPWEELVLSTRCRDAESGLYLSDPSVEFLLLLVRTTLKIRALDGLRAALGRESLSAEFFAEYEWLTERLRPETVTALARTLLGQPGADAVNEILASGVSSPRLLALRRSIFSRLRLYRSYTSWGALSRQWWRTGHLVKNRLGRRYPQTSGPTSRTNPRGGLLVAVVGADGSGKSTLTRGLASWLAWKVDARVIYFGSGDGQTSLLRRPLRAGLGLWLALRGSRRRSRAHAGIETRARVVWALVLAAEKRRTLRRAWRARNLGIVVLCDRFPQSQVAGLNDGPLLERWRTSRSRWRRALARWEGVPYRWAEAQPPDLVLKLHVSPEVARSRKPDMDLEELERREATVEGLRYPAGTRVVDLDARRPWPAVLLDARRQVWSML